MPRISEFFGIVKALAEVEIAMNAWLEAARKEGKPVPPPRYRPAIYQATR